MSGPQPFSTTSPLEKSDRRDRLARKAAGSPLVLPTYADPTKVKYETFVQDLQKHNAKLKELTQAEAQRALRQYFIGVFGREDFEDIKKNRGEGKDDRNAAAWARLRGEGIEYWKRR